MQFQIKKQIEIIQTLGGAGESIADNNSEKTDIETISSSSRIKTATSDFSIDTTCGYAIKKTKVCGDFINTIVTSSNKECIEKYYPIKFQL